MRARIWINKTKLASQQGASNSDQVRWERPEVVLNQLMLPHGEGARQKALHVIPTTGLGWCMDV